MKQYLDALKFCFDNGDDVESRAGKVRKSFGYQMQYDLSIGFPAITTKKLAWKSVVSELLWFIEGSNDERRLAEILYDDKRENLKNKKTIWTQNAEASYWKPKAKFDGDVGNIYGVQWRNFNGVDQLKNLIDGKGIYRLLYNGDIQYIGETNNINRRINQHLKNDEIKFDTVEYSVLSNVTDEERKKWEAYHLKKFIDENGLLPPHNRVMGREH